MNRILFLFIATVAMLNAMAVNTSDYVIDEAVSLDVNCDGDVTGSDVTAIFNYILNGNRTYISTSDVNGDGEVTGSDVTALYNYILYGTTPSTNNGSVITMQDFIPYNLTSYNPDDYKHQWVDGDVIFIAVDPDYSSACQNVYAMVRTGGKWVLQDVNGNNKQGFKTSGGKLCAAYVQHADLENSYYDYIPLKGDVACVNSAANYTVTPKNGKFYIKINDIILHHWVSRVEVNAAYEGDYFYGSVTHLDALTQIRWQPFYTYDSFQTTSRTPVIDIDSQHRGHAYGVWKKGTRTNGWLTLNYAKSNGYAYWWNYMQDDLSQGRSLTSLYSPWQNGWNRDLYMQYYNYDELQSYRLNAGSTSAQDVNINVGTNIIFRPWNGNTSDDKGTMTSVTSSTNGILEIGYDNTQVNVTAHKVGTTTLTIKFKTKDNINTVYTYNVNVSPTVWAAGKTADNKPIVWRNWQDKSGWLSGRDSYTSANEVIVRGDKAYVLMRKDVSNSNTPYYSGTAAILRATGAHGGGYFNVYKDGLTGVSKIYCRFAKANVTRYIASIPHMWVTKDNDVYYTSAYKDSNSDDCDYWVSTNIYKNRTLLRSNPGYIINDIATDDSGNLYYCGTNSNFGVNDAVLSVPYIYLGDATGYLAKLTTSNNLTTYPLSRYLFNRLFVKDGTVYVDAFGFYERDSEYETYYWSFGKNVFLRYTASGGLQLYTGQVSQNGLSMSGYNYNSSGTLVNPGNFILEGNKFYYSGYPIKTYQLGASQTASYTAYPSETPPSRYFDVKNGYIAMVLSAETNASKRAVACQLNNTNFNFYIPPMENSAGALIYDVWLQTSLDD